MGRRTFKEKEKIILFRCLTVKERRKKKEQLKDFFFIVTKYR